jgi:hypothetical protein
VLAGFSLPAGVVVHQNSSPYGMKDARWAGRMCAEIVIRLQPEPRLRK